MAGAVGLYAVHHVEGPEVDVEVDHAIILFQSTGRIWKRGGVVVLHVFVNIAITNSALVSVISALVKSKLPKLCISSNIIILYYG